jgi:hypothetical protein
VERIGQMREKSVWDEKMHASVNREGEEGERIDFVIAGSLEL